MLPGTACPQVSSVAVRLRSTPPPTTPQSQGRAGPLPQCQRCGLLILTCSSPTCQDERQEMGSSVPTAEVAGPHGIASHAGHGILEANLTQADLRPGWSGTAHPGCRAPCPEPLLTTDGPQPGWLPPLPVTGATSSEGHPPGAPRCPRGPAPEPATSCSHSQPCWPVSKPSVWSFPCEQKCL